MRYSTIRQAIEAGDVLVFGHRGAMARAPMNTLASFQLAYEQGAHGIELDVQLSKDGEIIILHDFYRRRHHRRNGRRRRLHTC